MSVTEAEREKYTRGLDEGIKRGSHERVTATLRQHLSEQEIRDLEYAAFIQRVGYRQSIIERVPVAAQGDVLAILEDVERSREEWHALVDALRLEEALDKQELIVAVIKEAGGSLTLTELRNRVNRSFFWNLNIDTLRKVPSVVVVKAPGVGHRIEVTAR